MEPIHFHPDNDPGGTFGEALHSVAGSLNFALRPYVQASNEAVLAGAERGELVDPNPVISRVVHDFEEALNVVGAAFQGVRSLTNNIKAMTPEEFAEARPEIERLVPNFDWEDYYKRNRLRDPGRVGKFFRPVMRVLGIEPSYWR